MSRELQQEIPAVMLFGNQKGASICSTGDWWIGMTTHRLEEDCAEVQINLKCN